MFLINNSIENALINHIAILFIFIVIHSISFYIDNTSFNGAKNYLDIAYFTTSTHSSVGYGDITANKYHAKITVMCHHIMMVFLSIQLLYAFINIDKNN
jgi:hypothetical protein